MADPKRKDEDVIDDPEVTFEYLKSVGFRTLHVDGAWGGLTPRGLFHMSFFAERPALPDVSRAKLKKNGTLQPERVEADRNRVVREFQVDLVMTEQSAFELYEFLRRHFEKRMSAADSAEDGDVEGT